MRDRENLHRHAARLLARARTAEAAGNRKRGQALRYRAQHMVATAIRADMRDAAVLPPPDPRPQEVIVDEILNRMKALDGVKEYKL